MNILFFIVALTSSSYLNTSFYTYRHIGHQSVTDLYLNYVFHRYDLRLALERRYGESGLKSFTLEVDSTPGDFRLVLGEKSHHIRAPISTYLNLWGVALLGRRLDVFAGKVRDNKVSLPPTFADNHYVIGGRLRGHLTPRMPLDIHILHRSDSAYADRVPGNTAAGINTEMEIVENVTVENRLWASLTELGTGASYAFSGRLTKQKYGGHCNLAVMSRDYVPFSSVRVQHRDWLRINTYQKPTEWLGFSQDLSRSSSQRTRFTFNTRIAPERLPVLTHSITLSREAIGQTIDGHWHHRDLDIFGSYSWSGSRRSYGVKVAQWILNCQVWSSLQRSDAYVWQFGFAFPFLRWFRLKGYVNHTDRRGSEYNGTGFEISSRIGRDLSIDLNYEYMRCNSVGDQFVSFGASKSLDLDRVGFSFISGRVFMDVNSNGIFDAADIRLSGIDVVIDGTMEAKTNKNGVYVFSFIKSGRHSIDVNLGSMPAEIGAMQRRQVVDTRLLSQVRIDFPLDVLGSVSGVVYLDQDNDGQMDDEETGAPNVVLALNGFLTTTDEEGAFRFANLASGTYILEPRTLPPETYPAQQQMLYVYVQPGADLQDCMVALVKKERPANIKVFD